MRQQPKVGAIAYVCPVGATASLFRDIRGIGLKDDFVGSLNPGDYALVLNVVKNRVHVLTRIGPGWLKLDKLGTKSDVRFIHGAC